MILTHVDLIEKLLKYVPGPDRSPAVTRLSRDNARRHLAIASRSGANPST